MSRMQGQLQELQEEKTALAKTVVQLQNDLTESKTWLDPGPEESDDQGEESAEGAPDANDEAIGAPHSGVYNLVFGFFSLVFRIVDWAIGIEETWRQIQNHRAKHAASCILMCLLFAWNRGRAIRRVLGPVTRWFRDQVG